MIEILQKSLLVWWLSFDALLVLYNIEDTIHSLITFIKNKLCLRLYAQEFLNIYLMPIVNIWNIFEYEWHFTCYSKFIL